MVNMDYIEEFTIIAKYKNLSSAARDLHTTQPVLSKHIAALEKQVGAELFNRESHHLELTLAGITLLNEACGLVAKKARFESNISEIKKAQSKKFYRVSSGLAHTKASITLDQVVKKYGSTVFSVKLIPPFASYSLELLGNGTVDAVIESYFAAMDTQDFSMLSLYKEPMIVLCEKTHRFAKSKSVEFGDLLGERFVSLNNNADTPQRKHVRAICRKYGFPGGVPTDFEMRDMFSYSAIFVQGLKGGVVVLPESAYQFLPILILEDYVKVAVVNEDCAYDVRCFYKTTQEKALKPLLEGLRRFLGLVKKRDGDLQTESQT
jgi:DNA-binding transcriptional LysR family regulator